MVCPGSVGLSVSVRRSTNKYAAAGTFAHTIAAECFRGDSFPKDWLGIKRNIEGFEIICDKEMCEAVKMYLDVLRQDYKRGDKSFIEIDLTPALATIQPDLGGTADFIRWRPKSRQLRVFDFKYGAGKFVRAAHNKQIMLYALGALITVKQPIDQVTVTIVQPRIEHESGRVRDCVFPALNLLDFAADVEEAAILTQQSNAPLVPGEVQCQFCPARHTCPELEKKQHALVAQEFSDVKVYDRQKLSIALDTIPMVEARIKAIREFAYAEAERGNPPPGYKLVAKRSTRRWIDEKIVIDWAQARAIDAFEEPSIKSPAQLEKGLKKADKEELAAMSVFVSSGHTLAPEADARPAVHKALTTEFEVTTAGG